MLRGHNPGKLMNLVPISIESIRIGSPLPFALRGEDGQLLAVKGFVVESKVDLDFIRGRGLNFFIDPVEAEGYQRALNGKLHEQIRKERTLGAIAGTQISADDLYGNRTETISDKPDWLDLQEQCNTLLHDKQPSQFPERLDRLQAALDKHARRNPDGTLFALIQLSATELRQYSATHAMLVSVMCGLAAREVLNWSLTEQDSLCKAALTMNLAMTHLQDRLATQLEAPTTEQLHHVGSHAEKSCAMLVQRGVTDPDWLGAVREHHDPAPGSLAGKTVAQRMARLIQRADTFAARLSPRAARAPTSPAVAMQATYFDENKKIDEAGAALIKAVGIYQPGSFVKLATNEIAVVVCRGANTSTPRVAVLVNRTGMPTTEHVVRDTSVREHRIVASVMHRDVKVKINLEKFLPLTVAPRQKRFG